MQLSSEDWYRLIGDEATNYVTTDFALSRIDYPMGEQNVLVLEAEHIESGVVVTFTFHIPPSQARTMAGSFQALAAYLANSDRPEDN